MLRHEGRLAAPVVIGVAFSVIVGAVATEARPRSTSPPPVAPPALTTADYVRADRLRDANARAMVKGAFVEPHWIGDTDRFWYRSDVDSGACVVFDAPTGRKWRPFDMARLAAALGQAADTSIAARAVTITRIELPTDRPDPDSAIVHAAVAGRDFVCSIPSYGCAPAAGARKPAVDEVASPDGRHFLFARDSNFWVRDLNTGAERQLTRDGVPLFAYGKWPDSSLLTVIYQRTKAARSLYDVKWSPDGRYVVGQRLDERAMEDYPFLESVPQDGSYRPIHYHLKLALLGDANQGVLEPYIIDVKSGEKKVIALPAGWNFSEVALGWSADGSKMYGLASTAGDREAALVETDPATGTTRFVIRESSTTHVELNQFLYSGPNVRILAGGRRAIWFSQRDGWGHLYLYDVASGALIRRLTAGEWLVRDIVTVDETRGQVYFTAGGKEPGRDPYYRFLYRVSLEGGPIERLTPNDADHEFIGPIASNLGVYSAAFELPSLVSPDGRYIVDTWSTVDRPPVTVVRSTEQPDSAREVQRADASALFAAGWRAPERFTAKAADGTTDLYGVIYYPPGYEKGRKYPVIDAFYGGPQTINAPRNFVGAVMSTSPISRASLAELGFIVVTIDGRGTPGRSKAFHDAGFGNFADPQIEDHVAVLKALAADKGFDLDRVGVYGHSFGGYTSARAILKRPDFYKVAVSSAGPHVYESMYAGLEILLNLPDYGAGRTVRPEPDAAPEPYHSMDNRLLAANLRGKLMLVYGDMDENALPAATFQLADALIKANRKFDLVYLPNRTHAFVRETYFLHRMWDYFVENLLGTPAPAWPEAAGN